MLFRTLCVIFAFPALSGSLRAQQGARTYQRISSIAHYEIDSNTVLTDSSAYQYHGDMSSLFCEEKYWLSGGWGYDGYCASVYKHSNHAFDPCGVLDVRYDTMKYYKAVPGGQLTWFQQRHIGWKDGAIVHSDRIGYGQDYFRYRTAQEAGSNGLPARIYELRQMATATVWDTTSLRFLSYSAQGRLVKDSIYNVDPGPGQAVYLLTEKHSYEYGQDGRLRRMNFWERSGNGWKEGTGYSYFYDAAGQLTQVLGGLLLGNTAVTDSQFRYLYEYNGGQCSLKAYETKFGAGGWIRSELQQFYRDNQQRIDSTVNKQLAGNGHYNEIHIRIYRDAGGLPLSSTLHHADSSWQTAHDSVVYRYESYQSTSLQQSPTVGLAQLYPNPARGGKLFLRWKEMPLQTSLEVRVMSLSGQCVRQIAGAVWSPVQPVELGDLPAGTYLLRVWAGGEAVVGEKFVLE